MRQGVGWPTPTQASRRGEGRWRAGGKENGQRRRMKAAPGGVAMSRSREDQDIKPEEEGRSGRRKGEKGWREEARGGGRPVSAEQETRRGAKGEHAGWQMWREREDRNGWRALPDENKAKKSCRDPRPRQSGQNGTAVEGGRQTRSARQSAAQTEKGSGRKNAKAGGSHCRPEIHIREEGGKQVGGAERQMAQKRETDAKRRAAGMRHECADDNEQRGDTRGGESVRSERQNEMREARGAESKT